MKAVKAKDLCDTGSEDAGRSEERGWQCPSEQEARPRG